MRMRALQFILNRNWDYVDEEVHVGWDSSNIEDWEWCLDETHLYQGVYLRLSTPDLLFFPGVMKRHQSCSYVYLL